MDRAGHRRQLNSTPATRRGSAVSGVQWISFHSIAASGASGPLRAAASQCSLLARLCVLAMFEVSSEGFRSRTLRWVPLVTGDLLLPQALDRSRRWHPSLERTGCAIVVLVPRRSFRLEKIVKNLPTGSCQHRARGSVSPVFDAATPTVTSSICETARASLSDCAHVSARRTCVGPTPATLCILVGCDGLSLATS